jgi:hypothetical protein
METVVAVFRPPADEGSKRRRAAGDAGRLAMKPARDKPAQEPDPAYRHIPFNLMTSIWSGATVGCIERRGDAAVFGKRTIRESGLKNQ